MSSTRPYKRTIIDRLKRDPAFAKATLTEAISLFANGEPTIARNALRDIVNAVIGFEKLAWKTMIPSKSLHRMLAARGNPSMNSLSIVIKVINQWLEGEFEIPEKVVEVSSLIEKKETVEDNGFTDRTHPWFGSKEELTKAAFTFRQVLKDLLTNGELPQEFHYLESVEKAELLSFKIDNSSIFDLDENEISVVHRVLISHFYNANWSFKQLSKRVQYIVNDQVELDLMRVYLASGQFKRKE